MVDFQCRQVLGSCYYRINPVLPKEIGLGAIKMIPDLLETAEKLNLGPALRWIHRSLME